MTDFADVEQFARQHAGCGGLSPSAIPQSAGGFTLTLTCTCGASFDRRVTAEEAKQPLPQIQVVPRPAPSVAPPATPVPPPAKPASRGPAGKGVAREDLEKLMRQALAAEEAAAASMAPPRARAAGPPPSGSGPTSRPRTPVTRIDLDLTIREALDRQRADAAALREGVEAGVTRRTWLAVVGVVALGVAGGAVYWFLGDSSQEHVAPSTAAPNTPQLPREQRAALDEVVTSLRSVQSSTPPDSTFP